MPALPVPDSYWVIPESFLAGEYPGGWERESARRRLDAFLRAGIETFIDLTAAGELPGYAGLLRERAGHVRFAIPDMGLPSPEGMRAILDALDAELAAGRRVYVHCWGGVGRTGTVVGCHLVRSGMSGEQALEQLAAWWREVPKSRLHPRSPETEAQRRFVRDWRE